MKTSSDEMTDESQRNGELLNEMTNAITSLCDSMQTTRQHLNTITEFSEKAQTMAMSGINHARDSSVAIDELRQNIETSHDTIDQLAAQTNQVGKILEKINAISDQTNLLALNAAIEAARAGEAGRGFAVVADEVRNLSRSTHDATHEIREVLDSLVSLADGAKTSMESCVIHSGNSLQRVAETNQSFNQIAELVQDIHSTSDDVNRASQRQDESTEEVTKGLNHLENVRHSALGRARLASESSKRLQKLAQTLGEKLGGLRVASDEATGAA